MGVPPLPEPKLYTVLIVPHQGSQMRTFAVSRPFAITAGVMAGLLLLGGMAFPHLFLNSRRQNSDLEGLRSHNAALSRDMRHVDMEMARLQGQIDHYEHQARKFALMAGLESLPAELEASGGPGETAALTVSTQSAVFEELNSLTAREERLSRTFEVLADAYQDREEYLDTVPTVSPVVGAYFGSNFGYRRDPFTGQRVMHRGQDIVANTGTPVRAPAAGRVSRAGRTGGLGIAIYLSHGRGVVSRFGHLSKLKVRSGQKVERGDIIGYVGSTGRSMGPHLHYEILVSGKHVDPRDFIIEDGSQPLS
jgi:murein DD-endopeptidase MepM/ murein hydrolase activator NlpD